jgi:hypothetical protein
LFFLETKFINWFVHCYWSNFILTLLVTGFSLEAKSKISNFIS